MATTQQEQHTGEQHDPYGHGHSVAAWTAVGVSMLGFLIMSIAVVLPAVWLFVVGTVVVVAAGVLGKLLSAMGFGAKAPSVR
jgi:hypothetical protein